MKQPHGCWTPLAAGLGKPKSELKALAEQGQLTTAAVVGALNKALPQLQRDAATMGGTISGAYDQVRAAVMQYVGANAEANGSARITVDLLRALAENIGVVIGLLQALAAVLIAGAIGRGAVALAALGGSAGTAAVGVGVLTGAMRGLLVLIGGPTGLAVAVGTLAAAWLGLSVVKQKAANQASDQARKELADLKVELADFESRKKEGKATGPEFVAAPGLRARIRDLEKAVGISDEADANAAQSRRENRRFEGTSSLQDPATIKRFQDENKLRSDIVKKFADDRAAYVKAKDLEISAAQERNDQATAKRLTREKAGYLAEQKRAEREQLKSFDIRDTVTRLAQAKQLYDQDFELLADATQREKVLLQEKFDQGLVDLVSYLADKKRLQNAEANDEKARLQAQLDEEQRVLAVNQKRLRLAKDPNAREQAQESVLASQIKIAQLETDIEKKGRDRVANSRQLNDEAAKLTSELREQLKTVDTQLKQSRGAETLADIQRRVQDQFAPQLAREFQLGGDGTATQALIDNTVRREELSRQQALLAQARTDLAQREEAIRIQEAAGAIDAEEAERQLLDARRAQLPVLQELARLLQALAVSPAEKAQAAQADLENKRLADLRTEAQKTLTATAKNGLGQFFQDIVTGSKTAGEALRSMLGNFANQMLQLITQRLGARLFESFGLGRVVDSAASFVATTFGFHQGGVVSAGGATFTRRLDLSPLAVAMAPRYHTGGIVGMAPNERLAVLQDGEEVLTAKDPRHVNNYRGSGLVVNSSVTVNGAGGTTAAQQGAGADLSRVIEGAIDTWAVKQSRPGGILSRN
jgi:hypothetical protein